MTKMFTGAVRPKTVPGDTPASSFKQPHTRRLNLAVEIAGPITRLSLRGILDMASAASTYDTIVASAEAPTLQVYLDLNDLETATRAGCRAIRVAAKLLQRRGGQMTIYGAHPSVEALLVNSGFDSLIEFGRGIAPSIVATSPARLTHAEQTAWHGSGHARVAPRERRQKWSSF